MLLRNGFGVALIVYIEDEVELRGIVAAELRDNGYDVAEAGDGDAGLDLIRELRPDLVLCDIAMPGLDGGAVLRRIRRENPEFARMPFIFLTARTSRDQIIAGKEAGADDYLTKPIDFGVLVATVEARLNQIARIDDAASGERARMLDQMTRATRLSFLSAADVLNHLMVGVVLLDAGGRVIFLNSLARRMIEQDDGLALHDRELRGCTAQNTASLREALSHHGSTDNVLTLGRRSGGRPYQVMIASLREADDEAPGEVEQAAVAVFIHDPGTGQRVSRAALSRLYGLSVAEARVVADLVAGLSPEDIGTVNNLSRHTVASQLKAAFAKTGTASQRELVSLVLQAAAVAPDRGNTGS